MKLVKKDFGMWNDGELSIIKKGYSAREMADYILYLQRDSMQCAKNCADFAEKYYKLKASIEELLVNEK